MDAARSVFLRHGFTGTRTREIANQAKITEAFLFRIFPNKQTMYQAAVLEPMRRLVAELQSTAHGIGIGSATGREVLRQMNQALARFMTDSTPLLTAIVLRELGQGRAFYVNELRPALAEPLIGVISKITGRADTSDEESSFAFAAIVGVHVALAADALVTNNVYDPRRTSDQLTQLFAEGMPLDVQSAITRTR